MDRRYNLREFRAKVPSQNGSPQVCYEQIKICSAVPSAAVSHAGISCKEVMKDVIFNIVQATDLGGSK